MRIALIVAAATNGVIGRDNQLPWYLPNDLKHFKQATMGKPVVMGRLTYESIGHPLPGRQNIVITRQSGYEAAGCDVVQSTDAAIAAAGDADEIMIIGGGQIYRQFLSMADRIYLTRVSIELDGDTSFPSLDDSEWRVTDRQKGATDSELDYSFEFQVLERQ